MNKNLVKNFLNYVVPAALVCSVGTNSVGAWPWENRKEKNDGNSKVLYLQDGLIGCDANSFKSFPILVKNFIYQTGSGNSYEIDISRRIDDKSHPFKVIIRKIESAGNRKNLAFWVLHGENLPISLGENIKKWIDLKEKSDIIGEVFRNNPAEEDDLLSVKCAMSVCAERGMNACGNCGFWTVCVCEDGSTRRIGTGNCILN